jgi:pimeloyl-ACP methyl ester carboxylesterase
MVQRESGYAEILGARIYYERIGKGPVLVFLHGFSFDTTVWDDQIDAFAQKYRILRYDLRGFGRSTSSEVSYTHAGDLKALLEYLHIREAYLAGLSLGGGAIINFALMFPGIARALILVAPSLGGFPWSTNVASAQASMQSKMLDRGIDVAREIWIRQTIFRHAMNNKTLAARLKDMVGRYSGWHWVHADLGKPMVPPAIDRLGEIRVPTLVMVGDEDAPDQLRIADILERDIAGSRKIVFTGVGHLVNMEDPLQFNNRVLEFLDNTG